MELKNLTIELIEGGFLIKDLTLSLNKGDKLAIIGEEGTGKSTILKCICNPKSVMSYAKVTGKVFLNNEKIGYCEQILSANWNEYTVDQFILKLNIDSEERWEYYNDLGTIYRAFSEVKLDESMFDNQQKISTLSGGEKVKLQIAKIIIEGFDILLLDEPTNDLDLETLKWLENFIVSSTVPIMYISHDVELLEKTANRILFIEYAKNRMNCNYTVSNLTYDEFVSERETKMRKQEQMFNIQNREYREKKVILSDIKSSVRSAQIKIKDSSVRRTLNKKMANILAQEERLKKFKDNMALMPNYDEYMILSFENNVANPNLKVMLDFKLEVLSVCSKLLSKNISLSVMGNKKIAIIGKNGCGKSTLLKEIKKHYDQNPSIIKVAYIPQDYNQYFDLSCSALDFLKSKLFVDVKEGQEEIDTFLACLKFTRKDMLKPISSLSYGQKVKIILLDLTLNRYNVLLLDEITRNLSPLSITVINSLFKSYGGTIISVTHDRKFISDVMDEIYELTPNGLIKQ